MKENQFSGKGMLLVLFSGIGWGMMGIFIRGFGYLGLCSSDIAALRALSAGLVLGSFFALARRGAFRIRLRDLWCMAGCGILSVTLFNICYFSAIRHTTINIAEALVYTSPSFVMILSRLCFQERLTRRKISAMLAVVLGCVLVSGALSSGGTLAPRVLFWGVGAGFCYALYTIFGRFAQMRGYDSAAITMWTFIFAGIAGVFILDWHGTLQTANYVGWRFWGLLSGLVLVSTVLPYCAYTAGLKRLTPSTSAIVATVEPLVGTLIGVTVFRERLSLNAATGMIFIIGAILLCGNDGYRGRKKEADDAV